MTELRSAHSGQEASLQPDEADPRLGDLPEVFRTRAGMLRRYGGAEGTVLAWDTAAKEVEMALAGHAEERLNLQEAATESGYTSKHLRRLVREGKLPCEPDGTILRRHVPIKPGSGIANGTSPALTSRSQLARAVAGGE